MTGSGSDAACVGFAVRGLVRNWADNNNDYPTTEGGFVNMSTISGKLNVMEDFQIREAALSQALKLSRDGETADDTVARANAYYAFLAGNKQ